MMKKLQLPKIVREFGRYFEQDGYNCYLVGGAVRNIVLGHKPTDYDFATDATPQEVIKIFRTVIPTGIKHGTVTVIFRGRHYEVTTFRVEGKYSNARHPDQIHFTPDLFEDLKRRDFTINSMAVHLGDGSLVDPHSGRRDLKQKLIRAIGNPRDRFFEDGLRLLRACRFAAQLEFSIEEETHTAMIETADTLKQVSAERIRDELVKMLAAEKPSIGLRTMEETGVLRLILPELADCRGVYQGGYHAFDVLDHSLLACDGAPRDNLVVRLAALLHDIGKASTVEIGPEGERSFHRHEQDSEQKCLNIMKRLKFSNEEIKSVCHLVAQHMFNYQPEWSDGAVRRFISRVGQKHLPDLFDLRIADQYGMHGIFPRRDSLSPLRDRIDEVLSQKDALSIKDLAVDGNILAQEAGIPKGPDMGVVLEHLLEAVMDDPSLNTKENLLALARRFYETYMKENQ